MSEIIIHILKAGTIWEWSVCTFDVPDYPLAYGATPDYHQACEQARIAWEQYSKGDAI